MDLFTVDSHSSETLNIHQGASPRASADLKVDDPGGDWSGWLGMYLSHCNVLSLNMVPFRQGFPSFFATLSSCLAAALCNLA